MLYTWTLQGLMLHFGSNSLYLLRILHGYFFQWKHLTGKICFWNALLMSVVSLQVAPILNMFIYQGLKTIEDNNMLTEKLLSRFQMMLFDIMNRKKNAADTPTNTLKIIHFNDNSYLAGNIDSHHVYFMSSTTNAIKPSRRR